MFKNTAQSVWDAGIFDNLELGRLSTDDILTMASMWAFHSLGPMQRVFGTLLKELTRVSRIEELLSGSNWQQMFPLAMQLSAKLDTSTVRVWTIDSWDMVCREHMTAYSTHHLDMQRTVKMFYAWFGYVTRFLDTDSLSSSENQYWYWVNL